MTEAEWEECADPLRMLEFLRGRASLRKMVMFAVGCCRRVWHLLADDRSRQALLCAESFADREQDEEQLSAAFDGAYEAHDILDNQFRSVSAECEAADAVYEAVCACYPDGFFGDDQFKVREATRKAANALRSVHRERGSSQHALLRDVCGNPFRPVSIVTAWQTPTVLSLAQAAYEERILPSGHLNLDCVAILADALEEADCTGPALLSHLRGPGPHVRGCWALDLVLGKT